MTDPITSIATDRLELRPLTLRDAQDVFRYASDPKVAENTAWSPHQSVDHAEAYVGAVVKTLSLTPDRVIQVWGLRLRGDPQVIGTIDFVQDSAEEGHIDFALAHQHWGQGLMTEAAKAVVRWGFGHCPELERIRSGGLSRNRGSGRVLVKVGFRLDSVTKVPHPPKFLEPIEVSHFVLTREGYEKVAAD